MAEALQTAAAEGNQGRNYSEARRPRCIRGRHGGPDVLHLRGWRRRRRPRARCACRGANWASRTCRAWRGRRQVAVERGRATCGGAVVHVWPVRARLPRRRGMRARMGLLEDVRGAAGDGPGSAKCDDVLGNGLLAANHYEDALSVQEAELSMMRRVGAPEEHSRRSGQSCEYVLVRSDGTKRPADATRRILWTFEAPRRGT